MNMFVFRPEGHGPLTFMVLAASKADAYDRVREYVNSKRRSGESYEYLGWPRFYQCEGYPSGVVATNCNH